MDVFFADDSKQPNPSRQGLSSLVAIGGIRINESKIEVLERIIDEICTSYGFPENEEFKWSPSRKSWMHANLVGEEREKFFKEVLNELVKVRVESTVVIVDAECASATGTDSPEMDATRLFLERVCNGLNAESQAKVITDKPGGGTSEENLFLKECIEAFKEDSNYTQTEKIKSISCESSDSMRLLQCADLVTGSTMSHLGGGARQYSQPIFDIIVKTFARGQNSIGGVGLKLHPDIRLRNLYHWLLGDRLFWKNLRRWRIPQQGKPYFNDENTF